MGCEPGRRVTYVNVNKVSSSSSSSSSASFGEFVLLPGGDASKNPNGQDDEKGSHAGASVAGPQRTGDDVVSLEGDGQDSQHRGVGHRQFHERHQFTFFKTKTQKSKINIIFNKNVVVV